MLVWRKSSALAAMSGLCIGIALLNAASAATESEEQKLVRLSKQLKPISNSQWNEIAGTKVSDTYDVQRDDTLWTVSKRLFGNPYYWPKVWALNNSISNPHVIAPGKKLTFVPGSSEVTPRLSTGEVASDARANSSSLGAGGAGPTAAPSRTYQHEYDKLPSDRWAPFDPTKVVTEKYDEQGFDKDLKIAIPKRFVFRVPSITNDTKLPFLGEIVSARRDGLGLGENETVFLKSPTHDLQVGTSYNIFSEPDYFRDRRSDRTGYIYRTVGEVKIMAVKDGETYIATITRAYDVIRRGDRVYPLLPLISDINPVANATAIEAMLIKEDRAGVGASQFGFVHLDRGVEDGVQVGNVFRIYEYYDPHSKDKITDSDFLISADAIVVHATAQFSTALIIRSNSVQRTGDFGVLLTDVSDLERKVRGGGKDLDKDTGRAAEDKELDELDALDKASGEGIGRKEQIEIKELEQWDKTKDQNPGAEEPSQTDQNNVQPLTPDSGLPEPGMPGEPAPGTEPPAVPQGELPGAPEGTMPQAEPGLDQNLAPPPGAEPSLPTQPMEPSAPPAATAPDGLSPLTPEGLEPVAPGPGAAPPAIEPAPAPVQ